MRNNIRNMFVATGIGALTLAQIADVRAEDRAKEAVRWNATDTWYVGATEFGCFMATKSARGTILLVGIDRRGGQGIVAVADETWRVRRDGKYRLELEFNDGTAWRGTGTGLGQRFLYLPFSKPEFIVDFATKKWMTVWYDGQYVTRLPLTGSLAALGDLAQCQQSNGRGYRNDPFDDDSRWAPEDRRPADRKGPAEREAVL